MVIASGADIESANPLITVHPLSRQVQRYVLFVTLARYDSSLAPEPYFARSWTWSPDRTTLRMQLHRGLTWHDGAPTTARDAAFTLDAARDPATGYPRYSDLADVTAVAAPDDTTLLITFARSQPRFPLVLCEMAIVPAHKLSEVPRSDMRRAAFSTEPLGNGPFRFAGRRSGQRWSFTRNASFPALMGGPPAFDRLVIAVVDEPTTKFAGLVGGELDVAGISPTMAPLVREDPSLRVMDYPVLFTTALVFNVHRAPLDDVRVRRALAHAVDRDRIIAAAIAGYGTAASGPVPPGHPFAWEGQATFKPAVADSLLDAANWPRRADGWRARDGRQLALTLLTVGSGDNAVEQLLQADFAVRGVQLMIRQREMGSFLAEARAKEKQFDVLFTGIPGDVSLSYLAAMFDSRLAGGALDYAGFHERSLDSLLAQARTAPSDSAARTAWVAVQLRLEETAPAAWIYHARGVQGVARRLSGVTMDLRGEMPTIAGWRLTAGGPAAQ
ncbi:MAG TPA: peptide ABC transporter substrate-binding protein [Gemmatimonadaceae bacterium]|nr:peptide ABC transporter substrate-binding protein [Gemmatimonadaceae bacterium]